jgi:hypothetical protein
MWSRFTSPGVLALAVVLIVLLVIWLRSRDIRAAIGLGVAFLLFMFICIFLMIKSETPEEQMKRKIEEMAAAVKAQNLDGIFLHISNDFHYGPLDKPGLRGHADRVLNSNPRGLESIEVWDFEKAEVSLPKGEEKGKGKIAFKVKPKGTEAPGDMYFRCIATFILDHDNQWRLAGFELFTQPNNQPVQIPQLPAF